MVLNSKDVMNLAFWGNPEEQVDKCCFGDLFSKKTLEEKKRIWRQVGDVSSLNQKRGSGCYLICLKSPFSFYEFTILPLDCSSSSFPLLPSLGGHAQHSPAFTTNCIRRPVCVLFLVLLPFFWF